jgi:hypothetical protein
MVAVQSFIALRQEYFICLFGELSLFRSNVSRVREHFQLTRLQSDSRADNWMDAVTSNPTLLPAAISLWLFSVARPIIKLHTYCAL